MYIAHSVTFNSGARCHVRFALAPKLSQTSTPPPATPLITSRFTIHNATTDTPQLGLTAPATISNTLAHPSRTTKCRHPSALLCKHSRHQIHIRPQARPLCAPPRRTCSQLHNDSSSRTESALHTPTHWSPGPQARHDRSLRPRDREAHTLHCFAGRSQRSRCAQDEGCPWILGCADWCGAEGA
jgi:hypothetical protein